MFQIMESRLTVAGGQIQCLVYVFNPLELFHVVVLQPGSEMNLTESLPFDLHNICLTFEDQSFFF